MFNSKRGTKPPSSVAEQEEDKDHDKKGKGQHDKKEHHDKKEKEHHDKKEKEKKEKEQHDKKEKKEKEQHDKKEKKEKEQHDKKDKKEREQHDQKEKEFHHEKKGSISILDKLKKSTGQLFDNFATHPSDEHSSEASANAASTPTNSNSHAHETERGNAGSPKPPTNATDDSVNASQQTQQAQQPQSPQQAHPIQSPQQTQQAQQPQQPQSPQQAHLVQSPAQTPPYVPPGAVFSPPPAYIQQPQILYPQAPYRMGVGPMPAYPPPYGLQGSPYMVPAQVPPQMMMGWRPGPGLAYPPGPQGSQIAPIGVYGPPPVVQQQQQVTPLADQLQQLDLQRKQVADASAGAQASAAAGAPAGGAASGAAAASPAAAGAPAGGAASGAAAATGSGGAESVGASSNSGAEDTWEIDYNELEVSREIARGSFGIVYQAGFRGTEVAVKKLINQKLSAEQMQEFIAEVNIMKKLHHPNVLLLIGVCTKEANLCMITEFMAGSMWNLLHDNAVRLDWKLQHKLLLDTAKGMNYLHLFKPPVLHRDLKSPNLLVDHNFNVKIADFGLARIKASLMTSNLGTCQYMAPEVIQSNTYTEKADVFSYGVVIWEVMTRQPPYLGMQPMQIAYGVVHQNLRPPIGPNIPQPVAALMSACWHQDPNQRPSFTEVLARLKAIAPK